MDIQTALQEFQLTTGIPTALYTGKNMDEQWASGEYLPKLGAALLRPYLSYADTLSVLITPDNFLCGLVKIEQSEDIVIVGPVLAFDCTRKQAGSLLKSLGQPLSRTDTLLRWLQTVPNHPISRLRASLRLLDLLLNDCIGRTVQEIKGTADTDTGTDANPSDHLFVEFVEYTFEERILSCVEYGRVDELKKAIAYVNDSGAPLPDFSVDSIRTFKNVFIISITLASRSANMGGMAKSTSTAISDYYLGQVENIETYRDFFSLWTRMLMEYTTKTAVCRQLVTDSLLVRRICKDILANIYAPITLAHISQRLGMSSAHLCRHFKQNTGMTITHYIRKEKVVECKRLLTSTDLPLSQIAAGLGFSSQNYMHTVFKDITGTTPDVYRNMKAFAAVKIVETKR